jgi:hypothetical protein
MQMSAAGTGADAVAQSPDVAPTGPSVVDPRSREAFRNRDREARP